MCVSMNIKLPIQKTYYKKDNPSFIYSQIYLSPPRYGSSSGPRHGPGQRRELGAEVLDPEGGARLLRHTQRHRSRHRLLQTRLRQAEHLQDTDCCY